MHNNDQFTRTICLQNVCYGHRHANPNGLSIQIRVEGAIDYQLSAETHHDAFSQALNGGIIGILAARWFLKTKVE